MRSSSEVVGSIPKCWVPSCKCLCPYIGFSVLLISFQGLLVAAPLDEDVQAEWSRADASRFHAFARPRGPEANLDGQPERTAVDLD